MHFLTSNAPFIAPQNSVQKMMLWVLLALVPGIIAMIWNFGYGVLFNILVAVSTAVIAEAIIIRMRGRSVIRSLADLKRCRNGYFTGTFIANHCPMVDSIYWRYRGHCLRQTFIRWLGLQPPLITRDDRLCSIDCFLFQRK